VIGTWEFTPLRIIFTIINVVALGIGLWALIDAITRAQSAFTAAGKQTKTVWLAILGVGLVCCLLGSFLMVASIVASLVYLIDVRPRVRELGSGRGGTHMGPYGPW
jgi:hypothetical protein